MREEGNLYVLQPNGVWRQLNGLSDLEATAKTAAHDGGPLSVRWFQRPGVGG